jgi:hypothetical protein
MVDKVKYNEYQREYQRKRYQDEAFKAEKIKRVMERNKSLTPEQVEARKAYYKSYYEQNKDTYLKRYQNSKNQNEQKV